MASKTETDQISRENTMSSMKYKDDERPSKAKKEKKKGAPPASRPPPATGWNLRSVLKHEQKWDQKYYDEHRRMVREQKATVDTRPPKTFMHLHLKLKKLQLEEERLATIERDNRILLEKMSYIMRTKGRVDNRNDYKHKSLNREKRMREMLRVTRENQEILKRIMQRRPEYSHEEWERQWQENQRFMDSIASFPRDWWKSEDDQESKKSKGRESEMSRGSKQNTARSERKDSSEDEAKEKKQDRKQKKQDKTKKKQKAEEKKEPDQEEEKKAEKEEEAKEKEEEEQEEE